MAVPFKKLSFYCDMAIKRRKPASTKAKAVAWSLSEGMSIIDCSYSYILKANVCVDRKENDLTTSNLNV